MSGRHVAALAALVALAALLHGPARAAEPEAPARDPMLPPPAARPAAAPGTAAAAVTAETTAPTAPTLRQILVVDGRRYVVEGTRLRGIGDRLGGARIERIADDAAWVRENGVLQRLPLHGGVIKKAAVESTPAPDGATNARPRRPVLAHAPALRPAGDSP